MDRFKNILFYANAEKDNRTALRYAAALAKNSNARIKVVDVIKDAPHYSPLPPSASNLNLHDILRDDRRRELDHLVSPYRETGLDISVNVLSGVSYIELIREVIKKEHDILITEARNADRLSERLFGTTTMHLMRKCPCPVWAIKQSSQESFGRILAAVDIDPDDASEHLLNDKIMELSGFLAETGKSEFYLIHVWDMQYENMLKYHAHVPQNELMNMIHGEEKKRMSWLKELVNRHSPGIPEKNIHLLKGEASELIPELARNEKIDLIVMGTLSRTGISGLFIGNTAEKILQQVNCSVLAIKPDGFLSPIDID